MAEEQQGNETQVQQPAAEKASESKEKQGVLDWTKGYFARRLKDGWESGHIQAAARQGVHELGAVFGRALPESTHIDEPGTVFSPLYRDMPSPTGPNIYGHRPDEKSPSQIANDNSVHGADQSHGHKKGKSL